VEINRTNLRVCFGDWLSRSLDTIDRSDVDARFHRITERHGWATANQAVSMLRSIYRRSSIDHEGLRNPVELWIAGGGRLNRKRRRRISSPGEVLPRWRAGMEAAGLPPAHRDIFTIGAYTGMSLGEVVSLRWQRIDLDHGILQVEETKTGEPLELPLTRQLATVLEHRRAEAGGRDDGWVFPSSTSVTGHLKTFTATMRASARQRARASGSTGCAMPSSLLPSATSCCPAPSPSASSTTPATTTSPRATPPTGPSSNFASPPSAWPTATKP